MESPLSFGKSNMLNASKKLPFVSIIIPNFNGKRFLNDCLTSVYQMNYPLSSYEVIIVDNKSTDGSKEYIQKNFPKVKVLALDNNYGFTGASNRGAEVAKGEALAFLNNDGVVDKDWLYCIVQVMVNNPKISLLGSQIILMRDRKSPQYSGGYLNLLGGSVFSSFHGHNPEKNYYFVGSICGAAFTIRKKIFEKIGGFDEDFFMYAEEGDLCMRAWLQGYTVTYVPNSKMYHYSSGTASLKNEAKHRDNDVLQARLTSSINAYYGNRNSIMMLIKNFEKRNIPTGLFFSYCLLIIQLFFVLRNKSTNNIKFLLKSGLWPLVNLKRIWAKHLAVQTNRKVSDEWLMKNHLLLSMGRAFQLVLEIREDHIQKN